MKIISKFKISFFSALFASMMLASMFTPVIQIPTIPPSTFGDPDSPADEPEASDAVSTIGDFEAMSNGDINGTDGWANGTADYRDGTSTEHDVETAYDGLSDHSFQMHDNNNTAVLNMTKPLPQNATTSDVFSFIKLYPVTATGTAAYLRIQLVEVGDTCIDLKIEMSSGIVYYTVDGSAWQTTGVTLTLDATNQLQVNLTTTSTFAIRLGVWSSWTAPMNNRGSISTNIDCIYFSTPEAHGIEDFSTIGEGVQVRNNGYEHFDSYGSGGDIRATSYWNTWDNSNGIEDFSHYGDGEEISGHAGGLWSVSTGAADANRYFVEASDKGHYVDDDASNAWGVKYDWATTGTYYASIWFSFKITVNSTTASYSQIVARNTDNTIHTRFWINSTAGKFTMNGGGGSSYTYTTGVEYTIKLVYLTNSTMAWYIDGAYLDTRNTLATVAQVDFIQITTVDDVAARCDLTFDDIFNSWQSVGHGGVHHDLYTFTQDTSTGGQASFVKTIDEIPAGDPRYTFGTSKAMAAGDYVLLTFRVNSTSTNRPIITFYCGAYTTYFYFNPTYFSGFNNLSIVSLFTYTASDIVSARIYVVNSTQYRVYYSKNGGAESVTSDYTNYNGNSWGTLTGLWTSCGVATYDLDLYTISTSWVSTGPSTTTTYWNQWNNTNGLEDFEHYDGAGEAIASHASSGWTLNETNPGDFTWTSIAGKMGRLLRVAGTGLSNAKYTFVTSKVGAYGDWVQYDVNPAQNNSWFSMYAGTYGGANLQILFHSTGRILANDGGTTRDIRAYSAATTYTIKVWLASTTTYYVYTSTNGGSTWATTNGPYASSSGGAVTFVDFTVAGHTNSTGSVDMDNVKWSWTSAHHASSYQLYDFTEWNGSGYYNKTALGVPVSQPVYTFGAAQPSGTTKIGATLTVLSSNGYHYPIGFRTSGGTIALYMRVLSGMLAVTDNATYTNVCAFTVGVAYDIIFDFINTTQYDVIVNGTRYDNATAHYTKSSGAATMIQVYGVYIDPGSTFSFKIDDLWTSWQSVGPVVDDIEMHFDDITLYDDHVDPTTTCTYTAAHDTDFVNSATLFTLNPSDAESGVGATYYKYTSNGHESFDSYGNGNPVTGNSYWNTWNASNGYEAFDVSRYGEDGKVRNTAYWNAWTEHAGFTYTCDTVDGGERGHMTGNGAMAGNPALTYTFPTANAAAGTIFMTHHFQAVPSTIGGILLYQNSATPANLRILKVGNGGWYQVYSWTGAANGYTTLFQATAHTTYYIKINELSSTTFNVQFSTDGNTWTTYGTYTNIDTNAGYTKTLYWYIDSVANFDLWYDNFGSSWNTYGPSNHAVYSFVQNSGGLLTKSLAESGVSEPIYTFGSPQPASSSGSLGITFKMTSISGNSYYIKPASAGGTQIMAWVTTGLVLYVKDNNVDTSICTLTAGINYALIFVKVDATHFNLYVNGTRYGGSAGYQTYLARSDALTLIYFQAAGASTITTLTLKDIWTTWATRGPSVDGNKAWGAYSAPFNIALAQSGPVNITYCSIDKAGNNETLKSTYVQLDSTNPTTTISYTPVYTSGLKKYVSASTVFTLNAYDNAGGSGIDYPVEDFQDWPLGTFTGAGTGNGGTWAHDAGITATIVTGKYGQFVYASAAYKASYFTFTTSRAVAANDYISANCLPAATDKNTWFGVGKSGASAYVIFNADGNVYAWDQGVGSVVLEAYTAVFHTIKFVFIDSSHYKVWVDNNEYTNGGGGFHCSAAIDTCTLSWVQLYESTLTLDNITTSWASLGHTWYKWTGTASKVWTHYVSGGFTMSGMTNGTYTISYCSWDNVGNNQTLATETVLIDSTAPTTTIAYTPTYTSGSKNWVTRSTTYTLTPADNAGGSGVLETYYKWTGTCGSIAWTHYAGGTFALDNMGNGSYTISYCSWDNTSNNETLKTLTILIDTPAPSTNITFTPAYGTNYVTSSTAFTLTANDGYVETFETYAEGQQIRNMNGWTNWALGGAGSDFTAVTSGSTKVGRHARTSGARADIQFRFPTVSGDITSGTQWWEIKINSLTAGGSEFIQWYNSAGTMRQRNRMSSTQIDSYDGGSWINTVMTYTLPAVIRFQVISTTKYVIIVNGVSSAQLDNDADWAAGEKIGIVDFYSNQVDQTFDIEYLKSSWVSTAGGSGISNGIEDFETFNDGDSIDPSSYWGVTGETASATFKAKTVSSNKVGHFNDQDAASALIATYTLTTGCGSPGVEIRTTIWPIDLGTTGGLYLRVLTAGSADITFVLFKYYGYVCSDGYNTNTMTWTAYDRIGIRIVFPTTTTHSVYISKNGAAEVLQGTGGYSNMGGDIASNNINIIQFKDNSGAAQSNKVAYIDDITQSWYSTGPSTTYNIWYKWAGNGNSIAWTHYTGPFQLAGMTNGTYTIQYNSWDNVLNNETLQSTTVRIDTIAPVTTIGYTPAYDPATGSHFVMTSTSFTLTANDNSGGSGIAETYYKWSGTSSLIWTHYTGAFTMAGMPNGTYLLSWCSWDNIGNNETIQTEPVRIDLIAPTTTIAYTPAYDPLTGSHFVTSTTSFTLTAADNTGGAGLSQTWYKWGGTGSKIWTLYTGAFQMTGMTNGTYLLSWCSWDVISTPNNETLQTEAVRIDTIAPTTNISYTPEYTDGVKNWVNDTTVFTLNGSDNAGGSGITYHHEDFAESVYGAGGDIKNTAYWNNWNAMNGYEPFDNVVYGGGDIKNTAYWNNWNAICSSHGTHTIYSFVESGSKAIYTHFNINEAATSNPIFTWGTACAAAGSYWFTLDDFAITTQYITFQTLSVASAQLQIIYWYSTGELTIYDGNGATTKLIGTYGVGSEPSIQIQIVDNVHFIPWVNGVSQASKATDGIYFHNYNNNAAYPAKLTLAANNGMIGSFSMDDFKQSWNSAGPSSHVVYSFVQGGAGLNMGVFSKTIAETAFTYGPIYTFGSPQPSAATGSVGFTLKFSTLPSGSYFNIYLRYGGGVTTRVWLRVKSTGGLYVVDDATERLLATCTTGTPYTIIVTFSTINAAGDAQYVTVNGIVSSTYYTLSKRTTAIDSFMVYVDTAITTAVTLSDIWQSWPSSAPNTNNHTWYKVSGTASLPWQLYRGPFSLTGFTNGTYTISYCSWDNMTVPNNETIKTLTVLIDTINPTTNLTYIPAYTDGTKDWVNDTSVFTLTAGDNAGGSGVNETWYKVTGTASIAWTQYIGPFSLTGFTNGTYVIWWCSWDNVGNNETINSTTVLIDTIAPTTNIAFTPLYTSGLDTWVTETTPFTLNAADNAGGSGLNQTWYKVNGNNTIVWTLYTGPFQLTGFTNGTYYIWYCSWDNTDPLNNETISFITVLIDTYKPTTTIAYTPLFTAEMERFDTHGEGGRVTGGNWNDWDPRDTAHGLHDVYMFTQIDGNGVFRILDTIESPASWPAFTFDSLSTGIAGDMIGFTVRCALEAGVSPAIIIFDGASNLLAIFIPSDLGLYLVHGDGLGGTTTTLIGDTSEHDIIFLAVNNTLFDIYVDNVENNNTGSHFVVLSGSLFGDKIASIVITYMAAAIFTFTIDDIWSSWVAKTWVSDTTVFILSANDGTGGSGVNETWYKVTGTIDLPWSLYTGPFSLTGFSNGTYNISYCSWDLTGYNETLRSVVVYIDTLVPTTTISFTPAYPTLFVNSSTLFTLTPSDGGGVGIHGTACKIGTLPWFNYTAPFAIPWSVNGTFSLYYYSFDFLRHVETPLETIVLFDTIAPNTTITAGAYSPLVVSHVHFTLVAVDNTGGSGVATTEYRLNGGSWIASTSFSIWNNETTIIEYRSTDNVGNIEDINTYILIDDPHVYITYYSNLTFDFIEFGSVETWINGTRITTPEPSLTETVVFQVRDCFGGVLYSDFINFSVTGVYLTIGLNVTNIAIKNDFAFPVVFNLTRNGTTVPLGVPGQFAVFMQLAMGTYNYMISYLNGTVLFAKAVTFDETDPGTFVVEFGWPGISLSFYSTITGEVIPFDELNVYLNGAQIGTANPIINQTWNRIEIDPKTTVIPGSVPPAVTDTFEDTDIFEHGAYTYEYYHAWDFVPPYQGSACIHLYDWLGPYISTMMWYNASQNIETLNFFWNPITSAGMPGDNILCQLGMSGMAPGVIFGVTVHPISGLLIMTVNGVELISAALLTMMEWMEVTVTDNDDGTFDISINEMAIGTTFTMNNVPYLTGSGFDTVLFNVTMNTEVAIDDLEMSFFALPGSTTSTSLYTAYVDTNSTGCFISIGLDMASIAFKNNFAFPVVFNLTRNGTTISFVIPSQTAIFKLLIMGTYNYVITYLNGTVLFAKSVVFTASDPGTFVIEFGWSFISLSFYSTITGDVIPFDELSVYLNGKQIGIASPIINQTWNRVTINNETLTIIGGRPPVEEMFEGTDILEHGSYNYEIDTLIPYEGINCMHLFDTGSTKSLAWYNASEGIKEIIFYLNLNAILNSRLVCQLGMSGASPGIIFGFYLFPPLVGFYVNYVQVVGLSPLGEWTRVTVTDNGDATFDIILYNTVAGTTDTMASVPYLTGSGFDTILFNTTGLTEAPSMYIDSIEITFLSTTTTYIQISLYDAYINTNATGCYISIGLDLAWMNLFIKSAQNEMIDWATVKVYVNGTREYNPRFRVYGRRMLINITDYFDDTIYYQLVYVPNNGTSILELNMAFVMFKNDFSFDTYVMITKDPLDLTGNSITVGITGDSFYNVLLGESVSSNYHVYRVYYANGTIITSSHVSFDASNASTMVYRYGWANVYLDFISSITNRTISIDAIRVYIDNNRITRYDPSIIASIFRLTVYYDYSTTGGYNTTSVDDFESPWVNTWSGSGYSLTGNAHSGSQGMEVYHSGFIYKTMTLDISTVTIFICVPAFVDGVIYLLNGITTATAFSFGGPIGGPNWMLDANDAVLINSINYGQWYNLTVIDNGDSTCDIYIDDVLLRDDFAYWYSFDSFDGIRVMATQHLYIDDILITTEIPVLSMPIYDELIDTNSTGQFIIVMLDMISDVYFSFYSNIDLFGLEMSIIQLFINQTRTIVSGPLLLTRYASVVVLDFAGAILYNATVDLSFTGAFVNIGLDIGWITFHNNYDQAVILSLTKNSTVISFALARETSMEIRLAMGTYDYLVMLVNGTVLINETTQFVRIDPSTFLIEWGWTIRFAFISNMNGHGIPLEYLRVYVNGTMLAGSTTVIPVETFYLLVSDYRGNTIYAAVINTTISGINLNIGLDASTDISINYYSTIDFIGLDFSMVKTYINGTRILSGGPFFETRYVNVTIADFSNTVIYSSVEDTMTTGVNLDIGLGIVPVTIANNYNYTVVFYLTRGSRTMSFTIEATWSITLRMATGSYHYSVVDLNGTVLIDNKATSFVLSQPKTFSISFGSESIVLPVNPELGYTFLDTLLSIAIFSIIIIVAIVLYNVTYFRKLKTKLKKR